jgi:hypothetical protein
MYTGTRSLLTLSGKQQSTNLLRLTGKNAQAIIPNYVVDIQINIMNNIIIPLLSSQWNVLKRNLFLIETLKPRLALYYSIYKLPELIMYQNILTICNNVFNEHLQLVDLEKQYYGSTVNNLTNIVYKTAMISLKPEYGLYNMIVGVPDFIAGQSYNPSILAEIRVLLVAPNVSYEIIKANVARKFNL